MTPKPKLTFAEKMAKAQARYGTYNPADGKGNPSQWRSSFAETMGLKEAVDTLGKQDPLSILGLSTMPDLKGLKAAYAKLMKIHHPDRGGDVERAKVIIAAYTKIREEIKE